MCVHGHVAMSMSGVIRSFSYSKGRGRGLLGLSSKLPGKKQSSVSVGASASVSSGHDKLVVAMHSYTANPDSPGGFTELSVKKGQLLTLCGEHPANEHWWEVKNEDGEVGFVPSSYVIIKEEQSLPWLQLASLKSEEDERKERVKRLAQQKSAVDGNGFGPAPKSTFGVPKAHQSAYSNPQDRYYCEICDKRLNGPKPYSAHMASRAHKEEVAALENQ